MTPGGKIKIAETASKIARNHIAIARQRLTDHVSMSMNAYWIFRDRHRVLDNIDAAIDSLQLAKARIREVQHWPTNEDYNAL